jgi:hypothetical protein
MTAEHQAKEKKPFPWRPDQLAKRELLKNGLSCTARDSFDFKLINWAASKDKFIKTTRPSEWACNYTTKGTDLTMEDCLKLYQADILGNPEKLEKIKELKGKLLVCRCTSEFCHAVWLAEMANCLKQEKRHD